MEFTSQEDLNKLLTIIDSCQTDSLIDFECYFPIHDPTAKKTKPLTKFINKDLKIILTQENKAELIKTLAENLEDGNIYHYTFFRNNLKIGQGFDNCVINFLDPEFFVFPQIHFENLLDVEVHFKKFE
jgi:hypothetical protein